MYKGEDAFLWLPTSFGTRFVICVLNHKLSEILTGRGSYTVILLVAPLGSLTIAKFNGVSVHCFVVALFQLCTYTTFEYLLLHVDCLSKRYNFTEYSGNVHACASSRYQAVPLLPRGLGTRLS